MELNPPVEMLSTCNFSFPRSPVKTPPTAVTKGDEAPYFKDLTYPESPEAKTTETPLAPKALISLFIRSIVPG